MHIPGQLLSTPVGDAVTLECMVEAYPRPVTYWSRNNSMVSNSTRIITQTLEEGYMIHMFLRITGYYFLNFFIYLYN